ncbi:hypothetical protein BGX21_003058 [Mortierella sp. AD011]|nr:hypothetical protein BGX20_002350 [Mortierella sp. AD010]KAF9377926.1 hypothetical protein BGX21_003058 [Mortierella sp. AD011]
MFRYIPQDSPQIQFASCKEFICTFRHPLLKLHQEGQLMPLISRLCDSGALREDISGDVDEDVLHLYSYQKNGPGQGSADADLAKMFRGLILDKRVYPPKIVCLPLLAFDTVEQDRASGLRFLSHKKQILEASVKMDGTSIVMTCYQGRLIVATKNRFKSLRSDLVKAILYVRNITESAFQENYTYICEYVGGPNCRVIEYPYEEICLLTVLDNLTGVELDYERRRSIADSLGFITPATVYFNSTSIRSFGDITDCFSEIYGSIEGVVVRTPDGRRVKMKTYKWKNSARVLYSVSPLSVWASKLRSTSLSWDSGFDEEHLLYTEMSTWLRERANDMLRFLKPKSERKSKPNPYTKGRISLSDLLEMVDTYSKMQPAHNLTDLDKPDLDKPDLHKPDPYDIYISDCLIFDVPKSRSAYRLHSRIVRDSANHSMKLCNNISACSTCIAVWFFLKPYNNYVDWESFSMLHKDRIRIVLEDDWHHLDTSQGLNIQWIGNSDVTDSVFQYMDHRTLSVCRQVCRHWHLYINQNFEDVISSSFYDAVKSRNNLNMYSRSDMSQCWPARCYLEYDYDQIRDYGSY